MDRPNATRPTWMEVDLDALEANFHEVRRRLRPGIEVIPSLKGNAYGHGIVAVAQRLATLGVRTVATGSFSDALALRRANVDVGVLMFGGTLAEGIPELIRQRLIPTVHSQEIADAVARAAQARVPVYVKVDCGHGRLGIPVAAARDFVRNVAALSNLQLAGLYTHLPFTDAAGREWASVRLRVFDALVAELRADGIDLPITQSRSSAAILAGLDDHCSAASPGSILFGKSPVDHDVADTSPFRPLMTVRTRIIHVASGAGDRSGKYPGRYADRVTGATAVVPFGRSDGNRPARPGKSAAMQMRGKRVPVLGVSLEHAVLDLSEIPDPREGEEVVVLGGEGANSITLAEIADWQGVAMSDVLMALNDRMPRLYQAAK